MPNSISSSIASSQATLEEAIKHDIVTTSTKSFLIRATTR